MVPEFINISLEDAHKNKPNIYMPVKTQDLPHKNI